MTPTARLASRSVSFLVVMLGLTAGVRWVQALQAQADLFNSAESGDVKVTHHALRRGARLEAHNVDGETSLVVATRCHSREVAYALIKAGADVNAIVRVPRMHFGRVDFALRGSTPLLFAVGYGDEALVKLLLARGANPEPPPDEFGRTIAGFATERQQHRILKLLLDVAAKKKTSPGYSPKQTP